MSDVTELQFNLTPPSDDQLRDLVADLGDEERHVLLEHGTEAPFCGIFLDEKQPGVYTCRLCGLPLFKGGTKFESGTGWPSFTAPFAEDHLRTISDTSDGMIRTEIVCARCGGNQGHVFPDGPPPTSAIASTRCRWSSRQTAILFPTSSTAARRKERRGRRDPPLARRVR